MLGGVFSMTDSTREREHATLHHSREELEQLLAVSLDVLCIADLDGALLFVNPAFERVSGGARHELLGRSLTSLVHPDDGPGVREAFATLARLHEPVEFSSRLAGKDGWRWLDWRAVCRGPLVYATAQDVTETRLAEQESDARHHAQEEVRALAVELAALPSDASVQDFLTRRLLALSGAVAALFSDYDPTDRILVTTSIEVDSGLLKRATRLLGVSPVGFRSPVSEKTYRFILDNVVAVQRTFTDVSFGAVPRAAGAAVKRLLGADHFIGLAYVVEGELYGTSVLAMRSGDPDLPAELLESFAYVAAVSLRRRRAEEELVAANMYNRGLVDTTLDVMITSDLEGRITDVNKAAETMSGYSRAELIGTDMALWVTDPKRIQVGFAQVLREGSQRDIALELKGRDGRVTPVLFNAVTIKNGAGRATGVLAAARDVTDLKQAEDDVRRTAEQLRHALEGTVMAMSHIVELRDPYTSGHQRRVAELAAAIGVELGMEADRLAGLRLACLIHDVGKLAVPAEILAKPGRLNDLELGLIKEHSQAGHDILAEIELDLPVAEIVLQHHERCDGSGYPHGLRADEILLEAKIIAVADVVEAMSSHRPYRAALGMDAAMAEVRDHAGVQYDADVAAACERVVEERGFQFSP